uniref:Protein kinase domain-containing protein n=1 Tax=Syphacia muris TaxID=451379 RepID=A0A0N5ALP1_9BILA
MDPIKKVNIDEVYDVYKQIAFGIKMTSFQISLGRFGQLKLAENRSAKCKIALKYFPANQTKQIDFLREYNCSFFLSPHPNVIDTYEGMYQAHDESAFFFVQEICPGITLKEAIENASAGIGEAATRSVMEKILSAVEFMHNKNLVHRNIRAENILIFDPKEFSKVKLTNFGLARKVDSTVKYQEYVNNYHAPELCETVVNEVFTVNKAIDIWALGIIFYYCLKGKFPWQKATIMCKPYWEWEQWIKRKNPQLPKRWEPFSEKALKLLKKTLNPKYKDRWMAKDVRKLILKEKLLKTQKSKDDDYNYYPKVKISPKENSKKGKRKSVIHQWISATLNTMAEISEQVVSARDDL